ncbi:RICIN domain-containing protein [Sphaerisporangium fuscum]|uniref:RICIN domain-containing protein n=1 Tax=Sphaerisporangium fuscum TaxID=2835868 RepID=UPI001BDC8DDB|nr:RICIN domain-containing protein [Sphaerisporangium fuscum]
MRRNLTRTAQLLVVATGCAAMVAGSTAASADARAAGPIHNHASWRCLDADLNTIANNGTKVQLWNCNGWNNQKWTYDVRTHTIRSQYNGRCLDADLNTIGNNGTKVQLWDCNGWSNQKWIYDAISHTVYSMYNGRCLDADLNTIGSNGTKVQLWDCNGWANQKWTI